VNNTNKVYMYSFSEASESKVGALLRVEADEWCRLCVEVLFLIENRCE
jgi:hypothetical protein